MKKPVGLNWQLQEAIWTNQDINSSQRLVALCLLWHRNASTGLCYPSYQTIAQETGLSRATVARAIASLRDAGFVDSSNLPGKVNSYDLVGSLTMRLGSLTVRPEPLINQFSTEREYEDALDRGTDEARIMGDWEPWEQ